jgi:hypothetical protein
VSLAHSHAIKLISRSKFKVARGGGRHFSRDLDPRVAERNALGETSEEESSEEEESDDEPSSNPNATLAPEMAAMNLKLGNTEAVDLEPSRAEKKAKAKAKAKNAEKKVESESESDSEESSEDELLNPHKATAKRQEEKAKAKAAPPPPAAPSRKEK